MRQLLFIVMVCITIVNNSCLANLNYPINSPYTEKLASRNVLFGNFSEQPKHLDPAKSYSADEHVFIGQIYEPPYEYHYLLRPYQLIPLSAENIITTEYIDNKYTVYTVKIKPNIYYQPHPAFARDQNGTYIHHHLNSEFIKKIYSIKDFNLNNKNTTYTRELVANDFIYQIKRLADPKVQSPIYSFMVNYIIDLDKLNKMLDQKDTQYIDLNNYNIDGLKLVDKYTYQIKIKGKYPQFKYWFAMPFFAPIPWEADKFYSQKELLEKNISLDTYPVGTGPYMLTENNPNQKIVLTKNPNYNLKGNNVYPRDGMPEDKEAGLLNKAGLPMPFIDEAIFFLEKESIPIWTKFMQGYYDSSGISSDNFDNAINMVNNQPTLTQEMLDKNIKLTKTIEPSVFYWGFNMLDPVVGGYSEKQQKLRHAISIAFDVEEYINIFRNGRGVVAHGPVPSIVLPGNLNGDINNYIYNNKNNKKSLAIAKKLLSEAGYPGGIDPKSGNPLVINFDATESGSSDENALFNWMREQFKKLNIILNIKATQYSKYQDRMRHGTAQMFFWGWDADYPDPENFLFLFLCKEAKVQHNGENAANYCNNNYDALFLKLQDEDNINKKMMIINQMINILRADSPWIFGFYNEAYILQHGWVGAAKPMAFGNSGLKYHSIDGKKRVLQQLLWNQPIFWPILLFILIFIILLIPVTISYYNKNYRALTRV